MFSIILAVAAIGIGASISIGLVKLQPNISTLESLVPIFISFLFAFMGVVVLSI